MPGYMKWASIKNKKAAIDAKRDAAFTKAGFTKEEEMAFTLPNLPYALDALEPHIDARTMEIHHGKHHAAYVNNLNKALEAAPALQSMPIEKILSNLGQVPDAV